MSPIEMTNLQRYELAEFGDNMLRIFRISVMDRCSTDRVELANWLTAIERMLMFYSSAGLNTKNAATIRAVEALAELTIYRAKIY